MAVLPGWIQRNGFFFISYDFFKNRYARFLTYCTILLLVDFFAIYTPILRSNIYPDYIR